MTAAAEAAQHWGRRSASVLGSKRAEERWSRLGNPRRWRRRREGPGLGSERPDWGAGPPLGKLGPFEKDVGRAGELEQGDLLFPKGVLLHRTGWGQLCGDLAGERVGVNGERLVVSADLQREFLLPPDAPRATAKAMAAWSRLLPLNRPRRLQTEHAPACGRREKDHAFCVQLPEDSSCRATWARSSGATAVCTSRAASPVGSAI